MCRTARFAHFCRRIWALDFYVNRQWGGAKETEQKELKTELKRVDPIDMF